MSYTDRPSARGTTSGLTLVPFVTLAFMALASWSLFDWQSHDKAWVDEALEYYSASGLERLEVPRYDAFLTDSDADDASQRLHGLRQLKAGDPNRARLLLSDPRFQKALHAQHIITPDDPVFADWTMQRRKFDRLMARTAVSRYELARDTVSPPWRWVTYAFLQGGNLAWLASLASLAVIGWALETTLGAVRFVAVLLACAAFAGISHILVSDVALAGSRLLQAGLLGVLWRYCLEAWVGRGWPRALRTEAGRLMLGAIASTLWVLTWMAPTELASAPGALDWTLAAIQIVVGFALARRVHADPRAVPAEPNDDKSARATEDVNVRTAREAHEAAARLDVVRAVALYRELLESDPKRIDYLAGYLNVALLGSNDDMVRDCALRILWLKFPNPTDEIRRVFLQLSQPKVLRLLPIDEHLRLARRLVKLREDGAALRLIDSVLADEELRDTYARQVADCLLGIFTTYTRLGLSRQAAKIQERLTAHYPDGAALGGVEKARRPPDSVRTAISRKPKSGRPPQEA